MTRFTPLTAALLAGTALVPAVQADVTPQQVWDATLAMMSAAPDTKVEVGGQTTDGDTLVLTDVVAISDIESTQTTYGTQYHSESHSEAVYTELRFTDNGDGTVSVTYPDTVPMVISGVEDDEAYGLKLTMNATGQNYVVSGDPEAMRHDFEVDVVQLKLDEVMEGDVRLDGPTLLTFEGLSGWLTHTPGEVAQFVTDAEIERLTFVADLYDLDDKRSLKGSGDVDGLSLAGTYAAPEDLKMDQETFPEGLKADLTYALGASTGKFDVTDEDGTGHIETASDSSEVSLRLSEAEVALDFSVQGMAVNVASPDMPFPMKFTADEYGLGFGMPTAQSDEPRPANVKVILDTVSLNDEVWDMIDPSGTLPRDPATLRVALSGMVRMLGSAYGPGDEMPAEPVSAQIDELTVDAVGLKAEGSGSVKFDNSDTTSYPGMPAPIGTLSFDVEGANALLDNLIKMGLIPQDQAMMGRMMMGMFAKPTGDDMLTSEIEFREGGQIFANGQRLK